MGLIDEIWGGAKIVEILEQSYTVHIYTSSMLAIERKILGQHDTAHSFPDMI